MNTLRQSLADYLVLRRELGYKLDRAGRLLAQFVDFCEAVARRDRHRRGHPRLGDAARALQPRMGRLPALRGPWFRPLPPRFRSSHRCPSDQPVAVRTTGGPRPICTHRTRSQH